jgi:hypothetical protein
MTTAIVGATALMAIAALPDAASAGWHDDDHDNGSSAEVLLEGLASPKGIAVNLDRDLVVAQGAFSDPADPTAPPPAPVFVYDTKGRNKGTVTPVTDPVNLTDVAISPKDGTGWGIAGDGSLLHQLEDGTVVTVANIPEYQAGDPDPVDRDTDPPNPIESNPYGLTIARNGDALVVDAAGNDLLRFTPEGVGSTMARFDIEVISTDHIPATDPPTLPPTLETEAVPTSVTIGPDGAIYVGELKGFPFRPGSSHIWRIKRNANGAWCSVNEPDPTRGCRVYDDGYTSIQDIAFNNNNGKLYVLELAAGGAGAFEEGFGTGVFPPAVLLEVKDGWHHQRRTELATGELSQPGGIVVTRGDVYVTDGMFTGGRLLKIDRN